MNITHLAAALLPSYIMLLALVTAQAICAWRDFLDTPVDEPPQSRRGNVHAEMRELRMKDD